MLDGDIIHVRRPDGKDYDAILHVNPGGDEKGLLMIYNPLSKPVKRKIKVNLYYTGLKDKVIVEDLNGNAETVKQDRNYDIWLDAEIPAKAKIIDGTVEVFSKDVKKPVAVRFAFSNTALPNLYNKAGLPASAFRTDNWDIGFADK